MKKFIQIDNKIGNLNKKIYVDGDKSLSIRWALLASQAKGVSKAFNLLKSEDVFNTLTCLKKLGIKIKREKNIFFIRGNGLNGFSFKKNIVLNAGNSGTLGRLIIPLISLSPNKIKLIGDKSLSKRDFSRIIEPLKKLGVSFFPRNKKRLPLIIKGAKKIQTINYLEKKGSAQCKTAIMFASLNSNKKVSIKAKKSRNHTEILFKHLKIPIKVSEAKAYDKIEISGKRDFKSFNYKIPGDISSSAFFIALAILTEKSKILLKNININPSRIGIVKILNMMGAKIKFKKIRIYKGEKIADIEAKTVKNLKAINCPSNLNSSAIDEFLIIFLIASVSKGISHFKNLSELNKKESKRLDWGYMILKKMGVKVKKTKNYGLKIWGNPKLELKRKIIIKDYLKDHRIFMATVIAALSFGGNWKIYDPDSIQTSFPSFLKIIKKLGGKLN